MGAETFPSLNPPAWPWRVTRIGLCVIAGGMLVVLLSGPSHRLGLAGYKPALIALGIGTLLCAIGALLATLGLIGGAVRRTPVPRIPAAVGIVLALGVFGYLLAQTVQARAAAMLHEVSTDLDDPPAFVAIEQARQRLPGTNPSAYISEMKVRDTTIDVPAAQRRHYPDIQPLTLDVTPDEAYARAERTIRELGWEVLAASPEEGRIEATDTTRFFGFKDDIAVRIRPANGGARVDVRSKSRVGLSDAGTNAKRVRRFLELMQRP